MLQYLNTYCDIWPQYIDFILKEYFLKTYYFIIFCKFLVKYNTNKIDTPHNFFILYYRPLLSTYILCRKVFHTTNHLFPFVLCVVERWPPGRMSACNEKVPVWRVLLLLVTCLSIYLYLYTNAFDGLATTSVYRVVEGDLQVRSHRGSTEHGSTFSDMCLKFRVFRTKKNIIFTINL